MKKTLQTTAMLLLSCALSTPVWADRIKDLSTVAAQRSNQLIGFGLVVGLQGTGDDSSSVPFTSQSMKAMLSQMGVRIDGPLTDFEQVTSAGRIDIKNAAAVMVTADLPGFAKPEFARPQSTCGRADFRAGASGLIGVRQAFGMTAKGIEIGRRVGVGEGVAIGSGRPVERSGTEFGGELSWAVGCRAVSDPHRQAGEKGGAPDGVGGVEALAAAGNDRRRARRFDFIQQPLQIIQRQERRIDGG